MRSDKDRIVAALDAADASYRELASLPLEALSRAHKQELLRRLQKFDKTLKALDRRLTGQLVAQGWADALSRRVRTDEPP